MKTKAQIAEYKRKRVARRKVIGLCLRCPKKVVTGTSLCVACKKHCDKLHEIYYNDHRKRGLCVSCTRPVSKGTIHCDFHVRSKNDRNNKANRDIKIKVLQHYGATCAWPNCGITDDDLLTIDHIENDGAEERRNPDTKGGGAFYRFLVKNGYPDKYQILCWNHQWKKRMLVLRGEQVPTMLVKAQKAGV